MKTQKILLLVLTLVLALGAISCQAQPAPVAPVPQAAAPTAAAQPVAPTVAPVAFDIKPLLDKYITNLPDNFGTIAPAALKDQMAATKVYLLDVREPSEIAANGFIDGSVNIPMRALTKNLDKLPAKDQPIVTYCAIGHRGAVAMETLQLLGYTNVKSLVGGFGAWKTANLPVANGTPAAPVAGKAPDVDKDLFAALDKYVSNMPENFYTIAPAALSDQIAAAKPFLLDVREPQEITDNGGIAGSVNIPLRSTFKTFDKLPQDKSAAIVAYCAIGHRGAMEMMTLQLLGYTNVKSLVGGFSAWKAASLPVVGGPFDLKLAFDKYFSALPDGFSLITPAAAKDQMAATKVFLLDMREASEITTNGYIEGAVNIPTRTLIKNLDKLPAKEQPIIVMCGSGVRSPLGMAALQMLGYTNVKSLTGGFNGWKAANLPVVMGTPAAPVAGKAPEVDKDLIAALDKWFTALPDGWNGMAPAAAKDQMGVTKVTLIDVREASEITANGMIEGSVRIPVRTLIKSMDKLPTDKAAPILVTCASGHRGMFSMMALQMLGYTNVKNISGGVNAWTGAGFPVVKPATMN